MTTKVSPFGSLADRLEAQQQRPSATTPAPLTHPQARHVLVQVASGSWVPGLMAGWRRTEGDPHWLGRVVLVENGGHFIVKDVISTLIRPLPAGSQTRPIPLE
jgi:hypothetical protein